MKKKLTVMIVTTAAVCIGMTSCGKGDSSDNTISLPPSYDWSTNVQKIEDTVDSNSSMPMHTEKAGLTKEELQKQADVQGDPNNDINIITQKLSDITETNEYKSKQYTERAEIILNKLHEMESQSDTVGKVLKDSISFDDSIGLFTFLGNDYSYGQFYIQIDEYDSSTDDTSSDNTSDGGWVR